MRRLWIVLGGIVVVMLGLVAVDIGFSLAGRQQAEQNALALVDRIDQTREPVVDAVDSATTVLDSVTTPVRAWSEVHCGVDTELSDGDGPSVIMGYLQSCRTIVYRVYALPSEGGTAAGAAALVHGEASSLDDGCEVSILGSIHIDEEATGGSWNTSDLTWTDTAGEPVDEFETCVLPEPGDVRSQESLSKPLTDQYYLVLSVANQGEFVGIGCADGRFLGFGACDAPDDAPYLPSE